MHLLWTSLQPESITLSSTLQESLIAVPSVLLPVSSSNSGLGSSLSPQYEASQPEGRDHFRG